jgi:hypothetical protein
VPTAGGPKANPSDAEWASAVRRVSTLIGLAVVALAGVAALCLLAVDKYRDLTYDWSQERHQGELICRAIMGGGDNPPAYWTPGRGWVGVDVYEVADPAAQDRIIGLIASAKARGDVGRPIRLRFYEREVWIESPKDARGVWGRHRGSEKLIRSCEL